jgi:flagellar basal-body rod protein FlgF
MDHLLYVAMNGASQAMLTQAENSHNLANVSTTGFRGDLAIFQSMPVFGPGYPTRVYNNYTNEGMVDLAQGPMQTTGRELDFAIDGEGWIAVQAADGSEAYTRAGDLRISNGGLLTTGAGHPVMGDGGVLSLQPFEKLEIGTDGTVTIQPVGQSPTALSVAGRIKLVNPPKEDLVKGEDGLMRVREDAPPPAADASVTLVSGTLEGSNVSAVEAMVKMIEVGRTFELQVQLMKQAETLDAASAQLMHMS